MRQITIKNIADELKLSVSTVSRALNDHPDIHDDTKRLVNNLASKLGYRPNIIARNLKSRTSNQIGVIVPEIRHDFFANAISGIEEVAYQKGYTIIIAQSNEQQERELINLNSMYLHRVAGVIVSISQSTNTESHFQKLIEKGVKMVFFDRVCQNLNVPKVHIDDFESAATVVRYLIKKKYDAIIHFAGPQSLDICRRRKQGYEQTLMESNSGYESIVIEAGMHERDGYNSMNRLLEMGISSGAIFAVNDPVAVGAVKRMKELKINIPAQIGIVGFSNNPITEMITPQLTTMDQHAFEMGKKAAEILINEIEGKVLNGDQLDVKMETTLIVRESA